MVLLHSSLLLLLQLLFAFLTLTVHSLVLFTESAHPPWSLVQAASAVTSWITILAVIDRPRGQLCLYPTKDYIQIRPSNVPNAGLGVFAVNDLPCGMNLGTYPGVLVPLQPHRNKLQQYPACEAYIWRFSDNQYVIDPTNSKGILEDNVVGGNPGQPGSIFLFENIFSKLRTVPTIMCRINEPPRGSDVNVITQEDLKQRCVTFTVERDIAAGEELYIDYGLSYDRSRYGDGNTIPTLPPSNNVL